MNIYVLCNYGDMDLSNYLSNANLTESDLQALKFTCASGSELQKLAQKGYGLPMAGVAENQVVNTQNNSLRLKVKKLFSRYDIYFDKSAFESKGYTINALYISASKSNTEVPYFVEGFQQTELSKLSLVDLGTPADIENLNQGDKNHAVTLYFLENCQGTKSGASKWYDVAGTNMPGKNLCSYIDIGIKATDALGNDANFFYWVYLGSGSGACVTDFNVRRNEKHTLKLTLQTPDVYAPTIGIKFVETDNELKYRRIVDRVYTGTGSISYYHWSYFSLPFQTNIPEGEVTYSIDASYTNTVTVGSYNSNTTGLTKYSYASVLGFNLGAYVDDVNRPITVRVGKKEGDAWVVFDECKILLSYSTPVITYSIDIVGDETATVGETVNLKAMFYTLTNGFPNSGEDVTNSATWSKVSGVGSVSSTGAVTSPTPGKCTVKVSYDGMGDMVTDTHIVTFSGPTDVITYSLEITGASTATVGSSVNLKAIYHTITNGVPDAGTDVTSLASWSIASGVGSVFGGTVTSSAEGTANVKATYSGETATHSVKFEAAPDTNGITLELDPTNIVKGSGRSDVTVKWNADGHVIDNSEISLAAYTTSTGSTEFTGFNTYAGRTKVGSDNTGTCYVEAVYSTGGKTYTSNRVALTITDEPVTVTGYEYKDLEVIIDADPKIIGTEGGTSTLTASATFKSREVYSDGTKGAWVSNTGTPDISGGNDTGFSRDGMTVTVASNPTTASRSTTVTASYTIGELSDTDSVTIEQTGAVAFDHYEYKDLEVTVDADPTTIAAAGGSSALTATATWKYRAVYSDGTTGEWQNGSDTPTLSLSGDSAFSRSDLTVSVGKNESTSSRSCTVTASYTIGELSDNDSVTIEQTGATPPSDDFEWTETSIDLTAGGDAVSASFKSTSSNPSFDEPTGIDRVDESVDSTPDSEGYYHGSASFKAAATCANGYSGNITGTAGTASDDLSFTVHKDEPTYSNGFEWEKTEVTIKAGNETFVKYFSSELNPSVSTSNDTVSDADVDDNSLGAANGYEFSGLAYIYVEDDTPDGTTFTVTGSAGGVDDVITVTVTNDTTPVTVTVTSMVISGPSNYSNQEHLQYSCTVKLSNGETYDSTTSPENFGWQIQGDHFELDDSKGIVTPTGTDDGIIWCGFYYNDTLLKSDTYYLTYTEPWFTYDSASLVLEKSEGGNDYYYVTINYTEHDADGSHSRSADVTSNSFNIGSGAKGLSVNLSWDKEEHGTWGGGSNVVPSGTTVRVGISVNGENKCIFLI